MRDHILGLCAGSCNLKYVTQTETTEKNNNQSLWLFSITKNIYCQELDNYKVKKKKCVQYTMLLQQKMIKYIFEGCQANSPLEKYPVVYRD